MVWTLPSNSAEVRLFEIANHMHIVGSDMLTTIKPASGADPWCVLHTPGWDFNWQRIYAYDVPIDQSPRLYPGDELHLRCRYDNTLDNPALAAALSEVGLTEPTDVVLGDETLDEMCIGAIGFAYRASN